jgi:methylated-DNA-protein-cysteine methyltransferase-like protein
VPWQRVVNSRGEVSARAHALDEGMQRDLLEEEGVSFDLAGRIDLHAQQWDGI